MEKNLYYQIQDKLTPSKSTLLRFAATDIFLYENESISCN